MNDRDCEITVFSYWLLEYVKMWKFWNIKSFAIQNELWIEIPRIIANFVFFLQFFSENHRPRLIRNCSIHQTDFSYGIGILSKWNVKKKKNNEQRPFLHRRRRREKIWINKIHFLSLHILKYIIKIIEHSLTEKTSTNWKISSSIKIHAVEICIDENEKWRNYFIDSFLLNTLICILMSCDGNFAELINEYFANFKHRHIFVSLARVQHCMMRFVRHLCVFFLFMGARLPRSLWHVLISIFSGYELFVDSSILNGTFFISMTWWYTKIHPNSSKQAKRKRERVRENVHFPFEPNQYWNHISQSHFWLLVMLKRSNLNSLFLSLSCPRSWNFSQFVFSHIYIR